ncbi:MAG: TonB-dependent receptor plug domain-containing protein, partial [Bacteroidota bacterium]
MSMFRCVLICTVLVTVCPLTLVAQSPATHEFRAQVLDDHHAEPLVGVNVVVEGVTVGATTNEVGLVTLTGVPAGAQTLVFSFVGFETLRLTRTFPLPDPDAIQLVVMEEAHEDLGEVAVTATRTSRTIADQATRVETIAGEEIDEKISMEPANITMLLNESPGIAVQQTSAVSGGATLRIQGLDGRYTQLLKDGFPLYGGFSGGLALLQIPPLDLQQVEVIKGPTSTLYGGDAIAGLVNLVSKGPTREPELSLLTNVTSAGGFDLGGFYSARGDRLGVTTLVSGNLQSAYDPDDDGFANLPEAQRLTVHPRLFVYPSSSTTLSLGLAGTFEERTGGDIQVIEDGPSLGRSYTERNTSTRLTSQARLDHRYDRFLGAPATVTLKNSVSHFDRTIEVRGFETLSGRQLATYSEASLLLDRATHDLVVGLDLRTDRFDEDDDVAPLD